MQRALHRESGNEACVSEATLAAHVTMDKPPRETRRLLDTELEKSAAV